MSAMIQKKKAWLILEDGTRYEGYQFGADAGKDDCPTGEIVFSTTMTGFQESLSDSNYREQIVVMTFPTVGIVGANEQDEESADSVNSPAAVICRDYCPEPSNFRSKETIDDFMRKRGIVGLCGVDTRELARKVRDKDVVKGYITSSLEGTGAEPSMVQITIDVQNEYKVDNAKYNIAMINFGAKKSFIELMNEKGCSLTLDFNDCDGVVITDGAANPNDFRIETIKRFAELKKPILAVGLGHQMLAIEMECEAEKLPNGHRGSNQPVRDLRNGNIYLTRQNHGYAVTKVPENVGEVILENVNDKSVEGIKYKSIPAISIQFDPSKHGGPRNTAYLVDEFLEILGGAK